MTATPPAHQDVSYLVLWAHWQAVVWAYGARRGRVMLCRWKLVWRRVRCGGRKRRRRPRSTLPSSSAPDVPRPESASSEPATQTTPDAEEEAGIPLRLVVRPGVILTKRGLQLRPLIARLGHDVAEYRALPRHGVMDEYFLEQDNGTDNRRIFGVTIQDPESTVIWHIVRVDRNDTSAFKLTLQHLKQVSIRLRAITTDGWPAILRAVREELEDCLHLLCYFHAKQNIFETLEKYRRAKKLPADAPELVAWQQAFFKVLDAPNAKVYRARLRALTRRAADEPILLARCESLSRKIHHNTYRLRSPVLTATTSRIELTFKFLTRKMESLYSFRRSKCNAAQKSLTTWALVRNFMPYLPGAKQAGHSPAQLADVDLQGLPWLQYINLKLSEVAG